mgnify:CR=1 FL=1
MEIIKKSGRVEEFNPSKVKNSVFYASEEVKEPLTDSDLKLIEKEVIDILKHLGREKTSAYEVFAIVLNVLKKLEFNRIGRSYLEGSIKF